MGDPCRPNDHMRSVFILSGLVLATIFLWAAILGTGYLIIDMIWGWPG